METGHACGLASVGHGHASAEHAAAAQEMRADYKVNIQRALRSTIDTKDDFVQSGIVNIKTSKKTPPALSLKGLGSVALPLRDENAGKFSPWMLILCPIDQHPVQQI